MPGIFYTQVLCFKIAGIPGLPYDEPDEPNRPGEARPEDETTEDDSEGDEKERVGERKDPDHASSDCPGRAEYMTLEEA